MDLRVVCSGVGGAEDRGQGTELGLLVVQRGGVSLGLPGVALNPK